MFTPLPAATQRERNVSGFSHYIARLSTFALAGLTLACAVGVGRTQQAAVGATAAPEVTYADQGWSAADRDIFYTTTQGSRMMPYAWFKALRRLDVNEPFAADQLQRYGYLRNDRASNPEGLPVGFVIDGDAASGQLGMTCAACHTGQLEYQKGGVSHALRLDGAPANADFQQFLTDLTAASRETLAQSPVSTPSPGRFSTQATRRRKPPSSKATSASGSGSSASSWTRACPLRHGARGGSMRSA